MQDRNLPWIENPFKLWSLIDVLKVSAALYLVLGEIKEKIAKSFETQRTDTDLLTKNLEVLRQQCDELGLAASSSLLTRAIKNTPKTSRELDIYFDALIEEMNTHLFFHIPTDRAKYYDQDSRWINSKRQFLMSFPEATYELNRAGDCYAFGEYTACVFHSMRAAEIGLRTFALYPFLEIVLDEPIDQMGWAKIIRKIEKAIELKVQTPKTQERDEELRYCSEAAAQFRYFNLGWRVFSAHARQIYEESKALRIMEAVIAFLESLAVKVKESTPS